MINLRQELERFQRGQLELDEFFKLLRPYYHSLDTQHRDNVVDILMELPEADASRELLLLFRVSLWRSMRIRIIRALARVPSLRALEFLMRLASNENDLPMCEEAIWALGRCRKIVASRFLCDLYLSAPDFLKPRIVAAIGESLEFSLAPSFLTELLSISDPTSTVLARNLALALAELKEPRVLPWLEQIILANQSSSLVHAALLAYGKVARGSAFLDKHETFFQQDMSLWHIAQSVRSHVLFRNQWKLEDYLQKIFESPQVHPGVALELNGFSSRDVYEGLKLFEGAEHRERMAFALGGISHAGVVGWYNDFFDIAALSVDEMQSLLKSISQHVSQDFVSIFENIYKRIVGESLPTSLFEAWAQSVVLALPKPEEYLSKFLSEATFASFLDVQKISIMNALVNKAIMVQKDPKRKKIMVKALESIMTRSCSEMVLGRGLRALGQIEECGNKTHDVLRRASHVESLVPSCLFFIEHVPSRQSCDVLGEIMEREPEPPVLRTMAFLKAAAEQENVAGLKLLPSLIVKSINGENSALSTEALLCVAAHPHSQYLQAVKNSLAKEGLRLPAIFAAKSIAAEELVEPIGACLTSNSESVVGRAVDALLSFSSARAKRLVLDFFTQNPLSEALCEKIVRSLEAPAGAGVFFAQKVKDVLERYPQHPMKEGLLSLHERLTYELSIAQTPELSSSEIQEVDKLIATQVVGYERFDDDVKSALRAAEMPFYKPEIFQGAVDKSSSVIAWCKGIDLVLERTLGRKLLFPKLDKQLADFQNVIHIVGLNDSNVSYSRLKAALQLEGAFGDDSFPGHKMALVAHGVLTGRILNEQWRILDGLRAWSVVILLFARGKHFPTGRPLVPLESVSEKRLEEFAKRLIALQDLRNPAAHRETWLQFPQIDQVRREVFAVFQEWQHIFPR
jgi:hypothetical protein